jgi:Flp pilus assembly protein TadG
MATDPKYWVLQVYMIRRINLATRHYSPPLLDNNGTSAIEFAIFLPIFVMFLLGVMEFGLYFVKSEITSNAVSTVSQTLQRNPHYYSDLLSTSPSQLSAVIKSYGSGFIDFTQTPNYICVDSYTTATAAQNALACTSTYFNTDNPNGSGSTTPYYVAVRANLKPGSVTPLGNFVPAVKNIQVVQSSGAVQIGSLIPPDCNGSGNVLQYSAATQQYSCATIPLPSKCNQPWQALQFDGTNYRCNNINYIIAGGLAQPSSSTSGANPGSYWANEQTFVPWMPSSTNPSITLCQKNVTFTVPSGLPPGQIIVTGSLVYPGAGGTGSWHGWSISFPHFVALLTGGAGSMDVCESNGGNWLQSGQYVIVGAEHISWSVIFIPN